MFPYWHIYYVARARAAHQLRDTALHLRSANVRARSAITLVCCANEFNGIHYFLVFCKVVSERLCISVVLIASLTPAEQTMLLFERFYTSPHTHAHARAYS